MIRETTIFIFLLFGIALTAMPQTKESHQEVTISVNTSRTKSDASVPEFPKLNFPDAGTRSPFYLDPNQPSSLAKTVISSSFPLLKQQRTFTNGGFAASNPLSFDFNNTQTDRLTNRFFIFSNGQKVIHAGLGDYTKLSSSLGWQPSKTFTIAAGGFVGRQFEFATLTQHDIMGASFRTKYDLTDKVQFNSWGQYANSGDGNTLAGFNTLFPHSGIGSSVSVKIKTLSKIEGGVEYQYNESTKVWNLESQGKISLHF
jgi:hypothetical protein